MFRTKCPVCGKLLTDDNYKRYIGPVGVEEEYIKCPNNDTHYYYEFAYGQYYYTIGNVIVSGFPGESYEQQLLKEEVVEKAIEIQRKIEGYMREEEDNGPTNILSREQR